MLSLLSALSLCLWSITLEYGSISRFKAVFRGFYGVCGGLCCLRALRGLWGFCARVELGGYKVCCVFASSFYPICSYLSLYLPSSLPLCIAFWPLSSLLWLSFFVILHCLCCFLFPFGLYAQKERAQSVVPCVLACPVVGCFILLLLCIPRTRQGSARQYHNKVLEKGNLIECSKLFCARLCSCLCSSKFVLFLFSYLFLLVGSCFLSPFRCRGLLYMFRVAFIASSFDFEKIHPAPQVRCALNLPPRVFKVSLIARVSPTIAIAFSE